MTESSAIEAQVWRRVIRPQDGNLTIRAAQAFAGSHFDQADLDAMHELAVRNQEGDLSTEDEHALAGYRHVGMVLDLLRAKGRQSLRKPGRDS